MARQKRMNQSRYLGKVATSKDSKVCWKLSHHVVKWRNHSTPAFCARPHRSSEASLGRGDELPPLPGGRASDPEHQLRVHLPSSAKVRCTLPGTKRWKWKTGKPPLSSGFSWWSKGSFSTSMVVPGRCRAFLDRFYHVLSPAGRCRKHRFTRVKNTGLVILEILGAIHFPDTTWDCHRTADHLGWLVERRSIDRQSYGSPRQVVSGFV